MNEDIKKDIEKEIRTWHPVIRDYWWIKFSNYKGNILLFVGSIVTGEVVTRYFTDENEAVYFINWIFHQDPALPIHDKEPRLPKSRLTKKSK